MKINKQTLAKIKSHDITIAAMVKQLGISKPTFYRRQKHGWRPEDIKWFAGVMGARTGECFSTTGVTMGDEDE